MKFSNNKKLQLVTMAKPQTQVLTYLSFKSIMREGLAPIIVPCQSWDDERIKSEIYERIKDFDKIEGISFSSFLNMIAQTQDMEVIIQKSNKELIEARVIAKKCHGILFNRYSLNYLITVFSSLSFSDKEKITGNSSEDYKFPKKYYEALLLANDLYTYEETRSDDGKTSFLLTNFIREWPYYYLPQIVEELARNRIVRYRYTYVDLILTLPVSSISALREAIRLLESTHTISLSDFFKGLEKLFYWFLRIPNANRRVPGGSLQQFGFRPENISSFYIQEAQFDGDQAFLKCLYALAVNQYGISANNIKNINYYQGIATIFDRPIYQGAKDVYSITDLGFLIDKIGSGLIWHLMPKESVARQDCLNQRGKLMEEYFNKLMVNIFPGVNITGDQANQADAILETKDAVLVFEFTTEKIPFASLYSSDMSKVESSVLKTLFLTGSGDPGKFKKMNDYVKEHLSKGKKIIPVLVTENKLGDYDLLDAIGGWLTRGLSEHSLDNLRLHKPIIIDLDDLETFWSFAREGSCVEDFLHASISWNNLDGRDKGPFHFAFLNYFESLFGSRPTNPDWSAFFRAPIPPSSLPAE